MTAERERGTSYVVEPGGGEPISGMGARIKASSELTGNAASVLEIVNPGFGGPPLHVHHSHDEMYYVLEGEYLLQFGDDIKRAPAGSFGFTPRGVAHTFASAGAVPGRLVIMSVPGGLEKYVQELDRLVASGAGEDAIQQAGEPWDTELVGPPLAPESAR
jgi:mannose-6-phosphate isomerase-like protein (cupin superfamily)